MTVFAVLLLLLVGPSMLTIGYAVAVLIWNVIRACRLPNESRLGEETDAELLGDPIELQLGYGRYRHLWVSDRPDPEEPVR